MLLGLGVEFAAVLNVVFWVLGVLLCFACLLDIRLVLFAVFVAFCVFGCFAGLLPFGVCCVYSVLRDCVFSCLRLLLCALVYYWMIWFVLGFGFGFVVIWILFGDFVLAFEYFVLF